MSTRRHVRRPGTPRHDRHLRAVDEPPAEDAPDEFLANVAQALAEPEPLAFLSLASAIVSTFDTRSLDPMDAVIEDRPDAASFLDTLVRHSALETTALLLALAALLPDNYLAPHGPAPDPPGPRVVAAPRRGRTRDGRRVDRRAGRR